MHWVHKEDWSQSIDPLQCQGLPCNVIEIQLSRLAMPHWHVLISSRWVNEFWYKVIYDRLGSFKDIWFRWYIQFSIRLRRERFGNTIFSMFSNVVMSLYDKSNIRIVFDIRLMLLGISWRPDLESSNSINLTSGFKLIVLFFPSKFAIYKLLN